MSEEGDPQDPAHHALDGADEEAIRARRRRFVVTALAGIAIAATTQGCPCLRMTVPRSDAGDSGGTPDAADDAP